MLSLRYKLRRLAMSKDQKTKPNVPQDATFTCPWCQSSYSSIKNLDKHIYVCTANKGAR